MFSKNQPPPAVAEWLPRVDLTVSLLSGLRTINVTCKIENGAAYFSVQAVYDELAQRRSAASGN